MKNAGHADLRARWWRAASGLLVVGLGVWGGWYLSGYSAGFRPDVLDGPRPGAHAASAVAPNPHQMGLRTYALCAGCHQSDGRGVPGLYPALAGSAILTGDADTVVRVALHGLQPDATDAMPTAPAMPGWSRLPNHRLAAVLTYARRSWGNSATDILEEAVAAVRQATINRHGPLRRSEVGGGAEPPANTE